METWHLKVGRMEKSCIVGDWRVFECKQCFNSLLLLSRVENSLYCKQMTADNVHCKVLKIYTRRVFSCKLVECRVEKKSVKRSKLLTILLLKCEMYLNASG